MVRVPRQLQFHRERKQTKKEQARKNASARVVFSRLISTLWMTITYASAGWDAWPECTGCCEAHPKTNRASVHTASAWGKLVVS